MIALGSVFNDTALSKHLAVNQAANNWRLGLYGALQDLGEDVQLVGHCPEQVWPLGELLPGDTAYYSERFKQTCLSYPNVAGIRFRWLAWRYLLAVKRLIELGCTDALLTYNPLPWHLPAARYAARKGVKWVSLVLDLEDPQLTGWDWYLKATELAAGHLFLSWWGYEQSPAVPKLHLDAGVNAWLGGEDPRFEGRPSVLYSGLNSAGAGLDLLVETVRCVRRPDVEFWITGKGGHQGLRELARVDKRVKLLGYVSDERLLELTRSAWVLLNPRDPSASVNRMAFPSKLLHYLSFGKPVVSTWTPGLAPEYREVLQVVNRAEPSAIAEGIEACLGWDAARRDECFRAARSFVVNGHTWSDQAERLMEFVEGL